MGSIEVKILGQTYSIKGDADTQYITQLADFVDMKTKEVLASAPGITPLKAAILAAINIADELYRLKQSQEELAEGIEAKAKMLSGLFD